MIYASLKTIRQWHNPLVLPLYLAFGLMTGALWLNVVLFLFGQAALWSSLLAVLSVPLAWSLKWLYWQRLEAEQPGSTAESATGLENWGRVRLLDSPHSEENYLQKELGYKIARKHAMKLRRLALVFGCAAALVLAVLALATGGVWGGLAAFLAALAGSLGVLLERWLFFAEATHKVTLYYGAQAA